MLLKERNRNNISLANLTIFNEDNILRAELLEVIRNLQDKRQQHVLLLFLEGFDATEIGQKMDISTNNVYVLKSRAIAKLKIMLK